MKVQLTRLKAGKIVGDAPLRTDVVEGTLINHEIKNVKQAIGCGETVTIHAEPLTEGATVRVVQTSPVKSIDYLNDDTIRFHTETGSIYELKEIK